MARSLSFWVSLLLLLGLPKTALSDDLSEFKDQLQNTQEKVRTLEEQLNQQTEERERLLNKLEANGSLKTENPGKASEANETGFLLPKLEIKGFADLHFESEGKIIPGKENPNSFSLGQFDFFITSALSEWVSVLSEVVFEFDEDTNDILIDVERIELKYSPSGILNIRLGRMHTPLGYWNQAFHHGAWFQTSASRPVIYLFEDEGGILPVHSVGIQLFGVKTFACLDWKYNASVSNGRGKSVTEIQNVKDGNDGIIAYFDKIPPDSTKPARNGEIDERILGGYVVFLKDNIEFLAELVHIMHDDQVSGRSFGTRGFYLMGAYQIGKWKPYYRFDRVNFHEGDPYFAMNAFDIDKSTFGIRWDPILWNSIKLEYGFNEREGANNTNAIGVHADFTF
jgi:hypothetical protein